MQGRYRSFTENKDSDELKLVNLKESISHKKISMFKGTLIENQKYYKLKSRQLLYIMLPSLAIGLLVNFYSLPIWMTVTAIVFYAAVIILTSRNQKSINTVENKQIEIDRDRIQIKAKDGKIIESIILESKDLIKVKTNYKMAQETMSGLKEEIKGNTEKHFLVIEKDQIERRLDFEINSYYMLKQLNKVVEQWQKDNYRIQYV